MVKKVVGFLVFAVLFLVVGGGVVMILWDRDVKAMLTPPPSQYPVDWQQQIRSMGQVPVELLRFAPDSVLEGDASRSLWSIADAVASPRYERAYQALAHGAEMSAADSATVAGSLTDTTLDVALAASRMIVYTDPGETEAADGVTLLSLPVPTFSPFRGIAFGLLTRAAAHLAADSQAAALDDIGAVLRIGSLIYRESVFLAGNLTGRNMMVLGAEGLGRHAAAMSDDSLGLVASALSNWARRRPDYASLVKALSSDAAVALDIARDTDVLPCWRVEAIVRLALLNYRPKNVPLGIPGSAVETVALLKNIAHPGVARMAGVAENTMVGFNRLGILERMGFLRGVSGSL